MYTVEGFPLITDRLIITEMQESDAPWVLQMMNEPIYIQNIADRKIDTEEKARDYIVSKYCKYYDLGLGNFTIRLRHMDFPIGGVGIFKREHTDDIDIGYSILSDYHGQGYATEATRAMMTYAKEYLGFDSLVATTSEENKGSQRVLEKLGFTFNKKVTWEDGSELIQFINKNI